MPPDFLCRIVGGHIDISCVRETPFLSLIIHPSDEFLHVLDCCVDVSVRREMLIVVCKREPQISVREILIDKTLHIFPCVLVVQIPLSLVIVLFDTPTLRRYFIHFLELWIYLNLELVSCSYLLECIYNLFPLLEHLLNKELVHILKALVVCCLIVIRDERHPFLSLCHSDTVPPAALIYTFQRLVTIHHKVVKRV